MERGRRSCRSRDLRAQPCSRRAGNTRKRIRAQTGGDFLNVFVMPRLKRCAELLRKEIADQRDAPVPQHNALIEQRERGVGIALMARAFSETRGS